jgi:hypothetical protein
MVPNESVPSIFLGPQIAGSVKYGLMYRGSGLPLGGGNGQVVRCRAGGFDGLRMTSAGGFDGLQMQWAGGTRGGRLRSERRLRMHKTAK